MAELNWNEPATQRSRCFPQPLNHWAINVMKIDMLWRLLLTLSSLRNPKVLVLLIFWGQWLAHVCMYLHKYVLTQVCACTSMYVHEYVLAQVCMTIFLANDRHKTSHIERFPLHYFNNVCGHRMKLIPTIYDPWRAYRFYSSIQSVKSNKEAPQRPELMK